jgi:hypothetical protein
MTTKKNDTQTAFEMWEQYSKSYTDFMFQATRKAFDQSIALGERMSGMWLDAARKTQAFVLHESETALKMAQEAQAQAKTAADRWVKMGEQFSAN